MNNPENLPIPEEMVTEVLEVAARLYADTQQLAEGYSLETLKEAGKDVQIPPELIEKAIAEVTAKRQVALEQKQKQKQQMQWVRLGTAGVGVLIVLWGILTYNSLVTASQEVEAQWAQVENQMQRRADLIPNLVSVTQDQAQQEQVIIQLLTQSRNAYLQANTPLEKAAAMGQIDQAITRFNQYVLANPQLQSSEAYRTLQYEIAGTENRIATERRRYNLAVQTLNHQVRKFPNSWVAGITGIQSRPFFEAKNQENPKVGELMQ